MEEITHLWDGEKWNGPITDGHLHLDRTLRTLMNDEGILSLYLINITKELEERRRKLANSNMC